MSKLKEREPLVAQIKSFMKSYGGDIPLAKIYDAFKDEKRSTIRGRINEVVASKEKSIIRTARGQYLLLGAEVEALVEKADTKDAMFEILKANIYYDLIFFDIPYKTSGQKGGNRDLSNYEMISPEEFSLIVKQAEKMLYSEESQVYFMIAGGKSSIKEANHYIRAFNETALNLAAKGSYTKLNANGTQCNMGKYLLPAEQILIYSPNGKLFKPEDTVLDFRLQRPPLPKNGGYPTQKPYELFYQIFKQAVPDGGKILDAFLGGGNSINAALDQKKKIHGIEISSDAIDNHILPKLEVYGKYYEALQKTRVHFHQGSLFDFIDDLNKDEDNYISSNIAEVTKQLNQNTKTMLTI